MNVSKRLEDIERSISRRNAGQQTGLSKMETGEIDLGLLALYSPKSLTRAGGREAERVKMLIGRSQSDFKEVPESELDRELGRLEMMAGGAAQIVENAKRGAHVGCFLIGSTNTKNSVR